MNGIRYDIMFKHSAWAVVMLIALYSDAQVKPAADFAETEKLKMYSDSIQKGTSDLVRLNYALAFDSLLHSVLKNEQSFGFSFDSLKNLSVLTSGNKLVRVYTFICPFIGGKQYRYFGYVQWKNKKGESAPQLIRLAEMMPDRQVAEKLMLNHQNWPGALYYKLISTTVKGKTIYTLLGWRGIDTETTMKLIDVMTVEAGKVSFGSPVFQTDFGTRQRILFEYNARAVMSLNYDEKKKRIVFDHLSPPSPQLTGNFKTYGPDFTYDAYQWKQGNWVLQKNVELRNPPSSDPSSPSMKPQRKTLYTPDK